MAQSTAYYEDLFLARFAADGSLVWMRTPDRASASFPVSGGSVGLSLATRSDGSVYVSGGFRGQVTFGDTTLMNPALLFTSLLLKYDTTGQLRMVRQAQARGDAYTFNWGRGVALTEGCAGYLTGGFTDEWRFAGSTLVSRGDEDVVLVRFSD